MAGTSLAIPINDASLAVKYLEDYVSQALNRAARDTINLGIIRGFWPEPTGADRALQLSVDPLTGDSALVAASTDASTDDAAVAYRETSPVVVDLSGTLSAGDVRTLALVIDYTTSTPTSAEYRLYTDAEVSAGDLATDGAIAICRVTMPGTTPNPIAAGDIEVLNRDDAWRWQASAGPMNAPADVADLTFNNQAATYTLFSGDTIDADVTVAMATGSPPFGDSYVDIGISAGAPVSQALQIGDKLTITEGDRIVAWLSYKTATAGPGDVTIEPALVVFDESGSLLTTDILTALDEDTSWQTQGVEWYVSSSGAAYGYLILSVTFDTLSGELHLNRLRALAYRRGTDTAGAADAARRAVALRGLYSALGFLAGVDDWPFVIEQSSTSELNVLSPLRGGSAHKGDVEPAIETQADLTVADYLDLGDNLATGGDAMLRTAADSPASPGDRVPVWTNTKGSIVVGMYAYGAAASQIEFVAGASWDDGALQWTSQGGQAVRVVIGDGTLDVYTKRSFGVPDTFADASWVQIASLSGPQQGGTLAEPEDYDVATLLQYVPDSSSDYSRLFEFGTNGALPVRFFAADDQFMITTNADWSDGSSNWSRDSAADSWQLRFDESLGITVRKIDSGTSSPWVDSAWSSVISFGDQISISTPDGRSSSEIFDDGSDLRITFDPQLAGSNSAASNPDSSHPMTNELRAKNVVKAWAVFDLPAPLSSTALESHTNADGFNIETIRRLANDTELVLRSGMEDDDYAVIAMHDDFGAAGTRFHFVGEIISSTIVYLRAFAAGSGSLTLPSSLTGRLMLIVMGTQ